LADLSSLGKRPVLVEWLTFPDNQVNPAFVDELTRQLEALGADQSAELYFICRSGVRSRSAAQAMAAAGYEHCHNVADGFEGALDDERHRGRRSGWKAEGLPWAQS
ncbi:MAG TPA: rhodanese-like domain-containing protein, partial [Hyphomicrobiaceae bacterium]|nr:rhodanese-like domain-containing protein [Hyphomicrobiaceae bacterium]